MVWLAGMLCVSAESYGALTYIVTNEQVSITDCDTSAVTVDLPVKIGEYPVTSIAKNAFANCSALKVIFYHGTVAEWKQISIGTGNEELLSLSVVCNAGKGPVTKTVLDATQKQFSVYGYGVSEGDKVFLALYKEKAMVEIQPKAYTAPFVSFETTKDYDTAKILVWSKLDGATPLTRGEILPDTEEESPEVVVPISVVAVIQSVQGAEVSYYQNGEVKTASIHTGLSSDLSQATLGDVYELEVAGDVITAASKVMDYNTARTQGEATTNGVDLIDGVDGVTTMFGTLTSISAGGRLRLNTGESISSSDLSNANIYVVNPNESGVAQLRVGSANEAYVDEMLVYEQLPAGVTRRLLKVKWMGQPDVTSIIMNGSNELGLLHQVFAYEYDGNVTDVVLYLPFSYSYIYTDDPPFTVSFYYNDVLYTCTQLPRGIAEVPMGNAIGTKMPGNPLMGSDGQGLKGINPEAFAGWFDQDGNPVDETTKPTKDLVVTARISDYALANEEMKSMLNYAWEDMDFYWSDFPVGDQRDLILLIKGCVETTLPYADTKVIDSSFIRSLFPTEIQRVRELKDAIEAAGKRSEFIDNMGEFRAKPIKWLLDIFGIEVEL